MKQNYFLNVIASVLLVLVLSSSAVAQYSFTALNTAVTENFNGMGTAGGAQGATGATPANEEFAVNVLPNWRVLRPIPSVMVSISLFGGADGGTGGIMGSGAVYNFGTTTDRMIGSICSNSTTNVSYGTSFVNNIPLSQINTLTVSFLGAQWRSGGRSDDVETLVFQYRVGGTDLLSGAWTSVPALVFTELNPSFGDPSGSGTGNGPLNGYLAGNQTTISGSITGLTLNVGQTIWFRWNDENDAGGDNAFAIDNLVVTPTVTSSSESDIAASGVAGVSVYANPTSGRFNVDFSLSRAEKVNISLVDLTGATRQVLQAEQALEAGSYSRTVDTEVAPGLYFVAVETSRGRKLTKLVVSE